MSATIATKAPERAAKPWYTVLYVQVLFAIVLGIIVGWLWPEFATNDWIKALGDGFIRLIKMVIAPIIFCTVVSGIAHIDDARKVGRVGIKALVYFEVVSSFALILGLIMTVLVVGFRGRLVSRVATGFGVVREVDRRGRDIFGRRFRRRRDGFGMMFSRSSVLNVLRGLVAVMMVVILLAMST